MRAFGTQVPIPRSGDLITTQEVVSYNANLKSVADDPRVKSQMFQYEAIITDLEKSLILSGKSCAVKKLDQFQDKITALNPLMLKKLLRDNFYDPIIMKEILCTMNSLFYLQTGHPGSVKANERVKHWLQDLKLLGEGAYGYSFKSEFTHQGTPSKENPLFVLKAPKNPQNDLIHELAVGLQLNFLRSYVPNFAYVFGGFRCTSPILRDTVPAAWCSESNFNVEYILYENINPSISMREYTKSCTFEQFLSVYLQILYALLVAQDQLDFCHYDLHDSNVLIKDTSRALSIPYTTENNQIEYLNTNGIATIIDYGMSHLKLSSGESIGESRALAGGVYPDRLIPLSDAYKLLMFSLESMLMNKNFECYQKAERLFRFFNRSEPLDSALAQQIKFLYIFPDIDPPKANLSNFLQYIRFNIPEFKAIVTATPKYQRVLGCNGTDVCVSDGEAVELLGYNSPVKIVDLFDFYDLVSRLEQENRQEDIQQITSTFDINAAVKTAYNEYNILLDKIGSYFENNSYDTLSICGLDCYNIMNPEVYSKYKNFLIETAEIKEHFQQLGLLYDSIKFANRWYPMDTAELDLSYNEILALYRDFIISILGTIRKDYDHLGVENVKQLKLPEMEVLIN